MYAHTQTFLPRDHGRSIVQFPSYLSTRCIHIYSALGGLPRALAHMLDSLVRVSRRVDERHFVRVPRNSTTAGPAPSQVPAPLPRSRGSLTCCWARVPNRQHCLPSVPFQQFQVLFHSLFKVLCIFPSRYLFAIGLPPIFSFRWNLPPA